MPLFAPAAIDRIDDHRDSIVTRDIGSGAEAVLGEVERDHQAGHCAVSSNADHWQEGQRTHNCTAGSARSSDHGLRPRPRGMAA